MKRASSSSETGGQQLGGRRAVQDSGALVQLAPRHRRHRAPEDVLLRPRDVLGAEVVELLSRHVRAVQPLRERQA
ncbi:hypothetical protein [Nonomuraea salmonea]|uniref:hypothetical protein n=1 Tax=Nonomuraea salmonea TaxID=46181 RepID=UPI0031E97B7D